MVDREYRDELLDASYEAVKLELENTEKDLVKLQERAEKLRSAAGALAELLPTPARPEPGATPAFLRKDQQTNGLDEGASHSTSEAARASA